MILIMLNLVLKALKSYGLLKVLKECVCVCTNSLKMGLPLQAGIWDTISTP